MALNMVGGFHFADWKKWLKESKGCNRLLGNGDSLWPCRHRINVVTCYCLRVDWCKTANAGRVAVESKIHLILPNADSRIRPEKDCLVVYLEKRDFRTIPYQDQTKFVTVVAQEWCRAAG